MSEGPKKSLEREEYNETFVSLPHSHQEWDKMLRLYNVFLHQRLILEAPGKICLRAFFFNQNGVVQYHGQLFGFCRDLQLMERMQGKQESGLPHLLRTNLINFSFHVKLTGKVVEVIFPMPVFMKSVPKAIPLPKEEKEQKR